ncbi:uncharacterized protein [Anabrus simplex]|uniref:uncharacterized protein n=1 Tax=Anabrus simplex TaxID=316456 RepID=UPI0034DD595F
MATLNGDVNMPLPSVGESSHHSSPQSSPRQQISADPGMAGSKPTASPMGQVNPQSAMSAMTPVTAGPERPLVPILQNVVSTVNLSCHLDLMKITFRTRNSEYNPQRFTGMVMRIRHPHTTALIFSSGKMVVTGARNESDSLLAAKKFARIIQKVGFNVRFNDFKVQNIVATYDFRFPVKVELLNEKHSQFSRYEPEIFPGLIYRMLKPRLVLLIFVNGKVVMTGAKTRQELVEALEITQTIVTAFRKR